MGDGITTIVQPLTEDEARDIIRQIRVQVTDLRHLVHEFDVRDGWRVLGYKSLRECFSKLLGPYCGESYLYRQLHAARVEQNLKELLPIGKTIPERVLRPLKALTPSQQYRVWKFVCEESGKSVPTSTAVEQYIARTYPNHRGKQGHIPKARPPEITDSTDVAEVAKHIIDSFTPQRIKRLNKALNKHLKGKPRWVE